MKPKKVKVAVDKTHLAKIFQKSEFINNNSSVIRQKANLKTGVSRKTKHAKFSEKQTFFTP